MKICLCVLGFIWIFCCPIACTLSFDGMINNDAETASKEDSGSLPTRDDCPNDPSKNEPGMCGCGVPDEDADGNTVPDCLEDDIQDTESGTDADADSDSDTDTDADTDADTDTDTDADTDTDTDADTDTDTDADTDTDTDTDPFSYCRSIVINHQLVGLNNNGALPKTGFPVLVSLAGPWLRTTAADPVHGRIASSKGHDIIFRNENSSTKLDHELETYNGTKGLLVAWLRVDSLSKAEDTTIYICYGNANIAAPTENPKKVWDVNFTGVWHLSESVYDEDSGAIHYDATSKNNNGIQNGNTSCVGKIAGAQDFDGKDDFLDLGDSSTLMPKSITVSVWAKRLGSGDARDWQDIVGNQDFNGANGGYLLYLRPDDSEIWWRVLGKDSDYEISAPADTSSWHLYTGTFSGKTSRIYVDGVLVSSRTDAVLGESSQHLYLADHGSYQGGGYGLFDGFIDEVRISNIARSPDWIATSYNNQSDVSIGNGKFLLSLGPEK